MSEDEEKRLIWMEIRSLAPGMIKAGENTIDLLLWSQGKAFEDVMERLNKMKDLDEKPVSTGRVFEV